MNKLLNKTSRLQIAKDRIDAPVNTSILRYVGNMVVERVAAKVKAVFISIFHFPFTASTS